MAIEVTLIGPLRDSSGNTKQLSVEAATVGQLLDRLAERFGAAFDDQARRARITVNGTAVQFLRGHGTALAAGDEVALMLPIGGG